MRFLLRCVSPVVAQGCREFIRRFVRSWRKLTCDRKRGILVLTHVRHRPQPTDLCRSLFSPYQSTRLSRYYALS